MPENCDHNCESCALNCDSRQSPQDFREKLNELSSVGKVIGIVSGKGGVGKSLVTSLLASAMQKSGKQAAIMDADITGPSIPKGFGLASVHCTSDGINLYPVETESGIRIMSMNLLLQNAEDPVVWRGPVIAGAVKQFWTDVAWGNVDAMFVDMPPGTGDVPLTVFQSLPVDGIIVVTSPQELVSMIVGKAVKMAEMMKVPVLGIVENMSYFECPDCGKRHAIFGESRIDALAEAYGIEPVAKLPIDPKLSGLTDQGRIEDYETDALSEILQKIEMIGL